MYDLYVTQLLLYLFWLSLNCIKYIIMEVIAPISTPSAEEIKQAELAIESVEKLPGIKAGRIIVRNLPFDLKEQHLKHPFERFGKVTEVSVPLNNANNLNKGFAFIEYENKADAQKAIDTLNG